MKYRVAGVVLGLGLAGALFYALDGVTAPRWAFAVAAGVGTGAFLVVDGSAGAGEGWIYHRVRSPVGKLRDVGASAGAGVLGGLGLAWLSVSIELGEIGASLLAVVGALLAANFAYLYKRPTYEQQMAEMEE